MSFKSKVIKSSFWSAVGDWGTQILSFAVLFVLARLLNPEDFGLIALAGVYIAFVQVFVDPGFSQALIQREILDPDHLDTAFWTNCIIAAVLSITSILVAPLLASVFREPQLEAIISVLSPVFLLHSLSSTQKAILSRNFQFRTLSIISLLSTAIAGTIAVIVALRGFGVWSLVAQTIIAAIISVALLWKSSKWRPGLSVTKRHFSELFAFGSNVLGINLLSYLNQRLDQLLIGYFLGATNLGYYSLARRMFTITTLLLVSGPAKVALPAFSRMQEDRLRLLGIHMQAVRMTTFFTFPIFGSLIIVSPLLIEFLFTEKWSTSAPILQFLCITGLFFGIHYFTTPVLLAVNRGKIATYLHTTNSLANVAAFFISVNFGIIAVSAAFSLRALFMQPVGLLVLKRYLEISPTELLGNLRGSMISAFIMALLSSIFLLNVDASPTVLLFVTSTICFISYTLAQFFLNRSLFIECVDLFHHIRK